MATLDHVGIRVTDLDRAIKFYSEMFGFEMMERRMLGSHVPTEAAAMKVSDQSWIFLLNNAEAEPFPPSVRGRPDHFCIQFEPEEFDAIMERLTAAGVLDRLDCELQPRTGATGRSHSQYILDPDNNQVEVKVRVASWVPRNGATAGAGAAGSHS